MTSPSSPMPSLSPTTLASSAAPGAHSAPAPAAPAAPAVSRVTPRTPLAREALLRAALLGIAGDSLLRNGFTGIGFTFWIALLAGSIVLTAWHRDTPMRREQYAWLGAIVAFAVAMAWRNDATLQAYDFLAVIGILALLGGTMAAGAVQRTVLGARARDLIEAGARSAVSVMVGVVQLIGVDGALASSSAEAGAVRRSRLRGAARSAIVAVPVLLLFGYLLASADPLFARLLQLPDLDFGSLLSHVVVACFFTWVTAGWLRGAVVDDSAHRRMADGSPFSLGTGELGLVLGGLAALFGAFVAVQIGWLFGGEALVRATTNLGYAEYARTGFFQLVFVALLTVPLLVVTAGAVAPGDARATIWHRRLSWTIIALLGPITVSAFARLQLYVHYYGWSVDRVHAAAFMSWVVAVLLWLGATVLRGRGRDFMAGVVVSGCGALLAMNVWNVDAFVARANLSRGHAIAAGAPRASAESPVDYEYLARNASDDATAAIVAALVAPPMSAPGSLAYIAEVKSRCRAVGRLMRSDARGEARDWRTWNVDGARKHQTIAANRRALRGVSCWDEEGEHPFGDRDVVRPKSGELGATVSSP